MTKTRKRFLALVAIGVGGTLFQIAGVPSGCAGLLGYGLIAGFDFCSVINCTSGTYFDFCDDNSVFVFVDCPNTTENP